MSRSGPVPPAAQTTIRGLWLCFWLTAVGMLVWTTVGPLPSTGERLPWLFAVVAALPVWFITGRLAAWVRQVSRHVSTSKDLRAVARWRIALLVFWILSALGNGTTTTSPLSFRVGLALACVAVVACVWRFGAVMLAVQATGTPEPAPAASRVTTVLPGWT